MLVSRGCSLLSISLSPEPGLAAAVFSLQSEVFMLTSIHKVALTIASTSGPVCTNRKWCLNVQCTGTMKVKEQDTITVSDEESVCVSCDLNITFYGLQNNAK